MADMNYRAALIVGAGSGLSASLARAFAAAGLKVALAARSTAKLETIAGETGAKTFTCDAAAPADVAQLFANVADQIGRVQCLWRLPGGAAGSAPHAAGPPRRHPVHRRVGEREGLRPIGAVRHGQVRLARTGPEHGARD